MIEWFEKAKRKLRVLRDLNVVEVSLTKHPAAPDARIALYKREEPDPMPDAGKLTQAAADAIRDVVREELGKALTGDVVAKTIGESLTAAIAELKKSAAAPVAKALDAMQTRADEIRKASGDKLTPAQAMARVIKANPELYAQHRKETARRRGDPRYED